MSTRRWLASWLVAIVLLAVLGAVAAFALGYFVVPYYAPGSKAVELSVISKGGPIADTGAILAAPSLADLTMLATAAAWRPDQRCSAATCWPEANVPKSSLLIALPTPVPCFRYALSADVNTSNVLEIQIVAGAYECAPGGLALGTPNYWLLAVPLDALPKKAVSIVVYTRHHLGADPDQSAPAPATMVDLRLPIQTVGGAVTATELKSTIDVARRDAEKQRHSGLTGIVGLGLFRWPARESLCTAPPDDPSGEIWGSFVTLTDHKTTFDYRSEGGATVFCSSHPY